MKAAADARSEDFVIMARTDALAVEGMESAIERAGACVEAGADMVFPEAIGTLEQYRRFVEAVGVPVLANIAEFGQTPLFTTGELADAGVRLVLYPLSAFRAMNQSALAVFQAIRADGTQKAVVERMQTRMELYDFLGYHAYEQKRKYAGTSSAHATVASCLVDHLAQGVLCEGGNIGLGDGGCHLIPADGHAGDHTLVGVHLESGAGKHVAHAVHVKLPCAG